MDETKKKSNYKLWRRLLAVVCIVALIASMFAFLSNVSIKESDGIGAETLAKYDDYVNSSAAERAGTAASTYLTGDESFDACYEQASVYIGKAKYEEALACVEKCLSLCNENTAADVWDDLWLKFGCLKAVLGQYDEALTGFSNMTDDSAYTAEKELICAQIALQKEDMAQAYVHLSAYLNLSPDDSSVYALYGDACYYTQRYDDAATWYTKAQTAGVSFDASEYMLWGLCLMETNGLREAVSKFDLAVENGYEDVGLCKSQCAICCYMLGEYENALTYGAAALQTDSQTVDYGTLVFYMGMSAFSLQQYDAAIPYFDNAEKLGYTDGQLWFYRGFSEMMTEAYADAIQDFTTASNTQTLRDSACMYRGICELQTGDAAAALADLTIASASEDENVSASAKDLLAQLNSGGAS